jgi:hypothetical protein
MASPDFAPLSGQDDTEELCLAAVQNTSKAFHFVPEALKTEEIRLAAVRKSI